MEIKLLTLEYDVGKCGMHLARQSISVSGLKALYWSDVCVKHAFWNQLTAGWVSRNITMIGAGLAEGAKMCSVYSFFNNLGNVSLCLSNMC